MSLHDQQAVARALVRRFITRRGLLEWETAAEAESSRTQAVVDTYLNWMPALAILIALLLRALEFGP